MLRENIRALKCYAGGQAYCIDIGQVLALERGEGMVPNPAAAGPCGWIVRRRSRIPVFGLAELLKVGPRSNQAGVVLILNRTRPWGMAVDRVARLEEGDGVIQPIPAAAGGTGIARFRGVISAAGSLILCLAPEYLRADATALTGPPARAAQPAVSRTSGPARTGSRGRLLLFSPPNSTVPADGSRRGPSFFFGLSYSQTIEIMSGVRYTPVPYAPAHVLGLIPWRSRPLPVLDAGALMGFQPAAARAEGRLVVVRSPRWRTMVALPMGDGFHTRTLPFPHWPCPPDLALDLNCARAAFTLGGDQVLVMPDLDAIAAPPGEYRSLSTSGG